MLDELEPPDRREEQRGVWTVDGQVTVTDRVVEFFEGAQREIVYMTVEELLTEELVRELGDAAASGVTIRFGGVSPEVQDRLADEVPEAELFDSLWAWSDTPAARLAMVVGEQTLVSALVEGQDGRRETAIWGEGEANSLVAVLRAIFSWRLRETTGG